MFQLTPAVWMIAGLILAALEMIVPGFVIIWFGVAGVITGILAIFVHNSYIQFGVFVVLSSFMVIFSQRIARRITHAEPELVGANRGLGFLINVGRGQYDTALVFVGVFTLVILALILYSVVLLAERRLLRWQVEPN